jgi:hypothetical protein
MGHSPFQDRPADNGGINRDIAITRLLICLADRPRFKGCPLARAKWVLGCFDPLWPNLSLAVACFECVLG